MDGATWKFESPLYVATIAWVPSVKEVTGQVTLTALSGMATEAHNVALAVVSTNVIFPVGIVDPEKSGAIAAVKTIGWSTTEIGTDDVTTTTGTLWLTVSGTVAGLPAPKLLSPLYVAVIV